MSNLALRLLTAALLIPLLIASIEWRNPVGVWLWVLFAQAAGLREWMAMTMPSEPAKQWLGVLLGSLTGAAIFWLSREHALLVLCFVVIAAFVYLLFRYNDISAVVIQIAFLLTGILYAGVLITPLALFKQHAHGSAWIYICLTTAWLSDTGAYFAGRYLGPLWTMKLYPAVSPKKTVVGAIGGLAGSILAVAVAKLWYLPGQLNWLDVVLIAVPANVLGQLGDLCESLIKRSVGVKDSGVLLPGHGGMLDRVDALVFAVPYIYTYATWR